VAVSPVVTNLGSRLPWSDCRDCAEVVLTTRIIRIIVTTGTTIPTLPVSPYLGLHLSHTIGMTGLPGISSPSATIHNLVVPYSILPYNRPIANNSARNYSGGRLGPGWKVSGPSGPAAGSRLPSGPAAGSRLPSGPAAGWRPSRLPSGPAAGSGPSGPAGRSRARAVRRPAPGSRAVRLEGLGPERSGWRPSRAVRLETFRAVILCRFYFLFFCRFA
jgi:hypothetical protein